MLDNESASLPALPGILETVLYAGDLHAAKRFYTDVMRLKLFSERDQRSVFFKCGDGMLLLFNPNSTSSIPVPVGNQHIPMHGTTGAGHMAFRIEMRDLDGWQRHLESHGIEIEARIKWRRGVESLYFRDPAGNSIELAVRELWFSSET